MAAEVTEVFRRHRDCLDPEMQRRLDAGEALLGFPGLTTVRTVEQSKAINDLKGPAVIMATYGMCTAGRIKHHLAQYIGRAGVHGPVRRLPGPRHAGPADPRRQPRSPHARPLAAGAGEDRADQGFSGHADHNALLAWAGHFTAPPQQVFITHGEEEAVAGPGRRASHDEGLERRRAGVPQEVELA